METILTEKFEFNCTFHALSFIFCYAHLQGAPSSQQSRRVKPQIILEEYDGKEY